MRDKISRAELCAFARTLGANPDQVQSIQVDRHSVTVVAYHLDEQGHRHTARPASYQRKGDPPNEVAMETTVIEVVGDTGRDTVPMRHPDLPGRVIDVRPRGVGQRAMAGWEVVVPPAPEPPKEDPPPDGGKPEAPAPAGASSSTPPRGRRKSSSKESGE